MSGKKNKKNDKLEEVPNDDSKDQKYERVQSMKRLDYRLEFIKLYLQQFTLPRYFKGRIVVNVLLNGNLTVQAENIL